MRPLRVARSLESSGASDNKPAMSPSRVALSCARQGAAEPRKAIAARVGDLAILASELEFVGILHEIPI